MLTVNIDPNLRLLSKCILSCIQRHRLVYDDEARPKCIPHDQIRPYLHGIGDASSGMYVFSTTDSEDLTLYDCISMLSITALNIQEKYNMRQCSASNHDAKPLRSTMLTSYVDPLQGKHILSDDCFFCCTNDYTFHLNSLGGSQYNCFPTTVCTSNLVDIYKY
jgi:hypothetical protein